MNSLQPATLRPQRATRFGYAPNRAHDPRTNKTRTNPYPMPVVIPGFAVQGPPPALVFAAGALVAIPVALFLFNRMKK